ncbi:TPA: hypothetical protein OU245_004406, partial [Escherichia coli]|nr:hypothetical protein [Escherichia coli]
MKRNISSSWEPYFSSNATVFETKIGAVLSEVASGVMNTKTKGKVSLNLEIEPFDENRVKIKHKL